MTATGRGKLSSVMRAVPMLCCLLPLCSTSRFHDKDEPKIPLVINTWNFTSAAEAAWKALQAGKSAFDAWEIGCNTCEDEQCDFSVGFGGSPDEHGETTLDAMVMDGNTMEMGGVAGLRRIKHAASVARHVLDHTGHSLLSGDLATKFAVMMGFKEESLSTPFSKSLWQKWLHASCQPNFWQNVKPNEGKSCGPYKPSKKAHRAKKIMPHWFSSTNHDTISMAVLDGKGTVVAGSSTNGAIYKIPGRVGDSPLPGGGSYADSDVGAALGTGDGDIMMRFTPTAIIVEWMRQGVQPNIAAERMIARIAAHFPYFSGALIAVTKEGKFGAACHNVPVHFPFSVARGERVETITIKCSQSGEDE